VLAVITARGGSKGLPRKNVLPLAGEPLIVHTIRAARESGCFRELLVSTDDAEIAAVSSTAGARVVDRPAELATDLASSLDVLVHALGQAEQGARVVLLQPTSPLRTARHVREAVALWDSEGASSCVSVTLAEHPPQKQLVRDRHGALRPLFDKPSLTTPRQALAPTYRVNGAFYGVECERFMRTRDLFAEPVAYYEMEREASIDIDDALDLAVAELVLRRRAPG